MTNKFSDQDKQFMETALLEANKAMIDGNYPCGAVLTVDGEIIEQNHNQKEVKGDRVSHAEMLLYISNSAALKKAKKLDKQITMYTTLEPCLMCFGAAIIHRVDRIVVSSPDPYGDMSKIRKANLGSFYSDNMPELSYGLLYEKTYDLTVSFLQQKNDEESLELIKTLTTLKNKFA